LKCEWYETKVLFIVTLYTLQQCFKKHGHYLRAKAQNLNGNLATISHNHYALLIVNNHFACCVVFFSLSLPQKENVMLLGTFWEPDGNLGNVRGGGGGGDTIIRKNIGPSWGHEEPSQWPHENIGPKNLQSPFSTKGSVSVYSCGGFLSFLPKGKFEQFKGNFFIFFIVVTCQIINIFWEF
jgi:hypothetical protein